VVSGGVARNMGEGLARLGENPLFISMVGNDSLGSFVMRDMENIPMETALVTTNEVHGTGVYNAVLDNGEMHTAINDFEIVEDMTIPYFEKYRDVIESAKMIVLDSNLPENALLFVCKMARKKRIKIWLDPTSTFKSERCIPVIKKVDFISPNVSELYSLAVLIDPHVKPNMKVRYLTSVLLKKGAKTIVVKRGSKGVVIATKDFYYKTSAHSILPDEILNVTGAGDSFNAGMIHGLLSRLSVVASAEIGLEAARYSLLSMNPINPKLHELKVKK